MQTSFQLGYIGIDVDTYDSQRLTACAHVALNIDVVDVLVAGMPHMEVVGI